MIAQAERSKYMAAFFVLMILAIGGCNAANHGETKNQNDSISAAETIESHDDNSRVKEIDIEEYIKHVDNQEYLFSTEGNFTGSNYKEFLAFYKKNSSGLDVVCCFVYDEINQLIIATYELPYYMTLPFTSHYNIDSMPIEALGREIIWNDRRFGFVGDFNENGKEEIYLYSLSGMAFGPMFYEFQDDKFAGILKYEIKSVYLGIASIDIEQKIINFLGSGGEKQEKISYIWDKNSQRYEILSAEYSLYK
jgi:hypothetical protein